MLAVLRGEESLAATARRYGVSETSLAKWRDEFLEGGRRAMAGRSSSGNELDALKRELAERDRVIGEITVANRYLKKRLDG
ncbi:MAG: helix-turn-helix domain-containing protein [Myxococcales bacterium]|nr:helix-turn-helix domain-containing protein [Myxococcales bacterium]